jgi:hypothetical protein
MYGYTLTFCSCTLSYINAILFRLYCFVVGAPIKPRDIAGNEFLS